MNTILVWTLIVLSTPNHRNPLPAWQIIGDFTTQQQCAQTMRTLGFDPLYARCVRMEKEPQPTV